MSETITYATVRFETVGFHKWPGASAARSYLADRHRHKFHIEASVEVKHDDREIEFHDLLDYCRSHFPGGDLGDQSCEAMARVLANDLTRRYGQRRVRVGVFEDGEVGAEVSVNP